jgi:hypothetical protein
VSHWLDVAAKRLAGGTYSRRDVLRQGGMIAAGSLIGSAAAPFTAFAATAICTDTTCPDRTCCEGRCLTDSDFGCCHSRIYSRLSKQCCPQAPAGGTHTCLDSLECCGKQACCKPDEICCGSGQCIPNKSGNIGCCNGFTYDKRTDRCCPEHRKDEAHFCAKNETCCGEKACCGADQECCGSSATAQCVPKGQCSQCPSGQVSCGGICCDPGNCSNGVCGCPLPGCTTDMCCYQEGYPNSGYCCTGGPTAGSLVCCYCGNTCAGYGMAFPCNITNEECSQMCQPC